MDQQSKPTPQGHVLSAHSPPQTFIHLFISVYLPSVSWFMSAVLTDLSLCTLHTVTVKQSASQPQ